MSHLTYAEAVVTGLIQGVTELFPVSSLGHNVLLPALIGGQWAKDLNVSAHGSPYLAFIVGLHVATAVAMIAYFWRDWVRIVRGFFTSLRRREIVTADQRLAWMIVLATIPVGIAGAALQKVFTSVFAKPELTALFLAANGVILIYCERQRRARAVPRSVAHAQAGRAAHGAPAYGGAAHGGPVQGGYQPSSQPPWQQQWQDQDPRYGAAQFAGEPPLSQVPQFGPQVGQTPQVGQDPRYAGNPQYAGDSRYGTDPRYAGEPRYGQAPWSDQDPWGAPPAQQAPWADDGRWGGQPAQQAPRGDAGAGQENSGPGDDSAVAADRRLSVMGYGKAILVGSAQILALLPGISRDGMVTVAGMGRGLTREDAVRYSFLLSAPVILAAGLLKAHDLLGPAGKGIHGPVIAGSLLAGIGAYLSVRFLTRYFSESRSLTPFGIYCLIAGVLSFAYLLIK